MRVVLKSKLVINFDRAIKAAADSGCEIICFKLESETENKMMRDYISLQSGYIDWCDYDYEGILVREYVADNKPDIADDHLFTRVKGLPTKEIDGTLYYLIEPSTGGISNKEHWLHDFDQMVRHFCTILSEDEMIRYSKEVISKVYAK